jgi:uncharacterized protein (TIRG00374 family)
MLIAIQGITSSIYAVQYIVLKQSNNFLHVLKITIIGIFYGTIIPGQIAGDVVKTYKFGRAKQNMVNSVAAILLTKFTFFLSISFLCAIGLFFSDFNNTYLLIFFILIFLIALFCSISFSNKRMARLFNLLLEKVPAKPRIFKNTANKILSVSLHGDFYFTTNQIIINILLSILLNFIGVLSFYLLLIKAGHIISLFDLLWANGATALVAIIPLSFGGLGLTQFTNVELLKFFNIPPETTLAISIISFVPGLFFVILGGLLDLHDNLITMKKHTNE